MPRVRLKPGEWGKITVSPFKSNFMARAKIRDMDGRVRVVTSLGPSEGAARARLQGRLINRVAPVDTDQLSSASPVHQLAAYWLAGKQESVSPQTLAGYERFWDNDCRPALGELLIREVTASAIDALVRRVAGRSPSAARGVRVVCSGMFATAVRLDLIEHNPVRETRLARVKRKPIRVVLPSELAAMRVSVDRFMRREALTVDGVTAARTGGPKPSSTLGDVLEVLIGTGGRISEVLALRWADIHLDDAGVSTVTFRATLVVPRYKGERLRLQEYRKGDAPPLTVVLPLFAADVLRRRRTKTPPTDEQEPVFATSTGNWVSPSNVRRAWRAALGAEFAWVHPHSLRKTVATLVKEQYGVEAAQIQLGHANSRVTEAHYIQRVNQSPDMTSAFDLFAPTENEKVE